MLFTTILSTSIVPLDVKQQMVTGISMLDKLQAFLWDRGPDILVAILIFIVGRYICQFFRRMAHRMMEKANYDATVNTFISELTYYGLLAIVLLSALNKAGVPTNSFIAAFGAIGIAVGLALQGNLSNFASGLLILVFKPFKAGDWITVNDVGGSVQSISFLNTAIITKENKIVFIPNSMITSNKVINNNYTPTRYIPFTFDISYSNDHHKAIAIIKEIFHDDDRIKNADTVEIGIKAFGDNSVQIAAYPMVENADYLPVFYSVMSEVKDRFDANGIDIPFPQRVVHVESVPKEMTSHDSH